ncbi:MAG: dihydropteroate synthase [Planctomycetota bacterium]|nr:MAG: dihydropteroate synthase [Planctomycetota bacterium]
MGAAVKPALVTWDDGEAACLMGIVNLTPDSFSDGGELGNWDQVLARADQHLAHGAQWLDLGAESTRPGAAPVSEDEELSRLLPVLQGLRQHRPQARLSVDTRHGRVAMAALAAGAHLINDVGGGRDPGLLEAVAAADAGLILMHMQGEPGSMQVAPTYRDVVAEVEGFLAAQLSFATAAGVRREAILLDPGIGFGKTPEHNLALLRALPRLRQSLGRPLVLAVSRKSLFPALLGPGLSMAERDAASHMVHALLAAQVAVIRAHDCRGASHALTLARALSCGVMP